MQFSVSPTARILKFIVIILSFTLLAAAQSTTASRTTSHLYKVERATGQVIADTYSGTQLQGATSLVSEVGPGWRLVGVADFKAGVQGMVYAERSSGALAVLFYGGADGTQLVGSSSLATPGAEWIAAVVADMDRDGHPDVVFVNKTTGQVDVYFLGGAQGTTLLDRRTVSLLSATGWNLVGAADVNSDGHTELVLQNPSTGQVMVDFLDAKGTTVKATQTLGSFADWAAAGMLDMNGDGHPDLILSNAAGQIQVANFGGANGTTSLGSAYLDRSGSAGWSVVVPSFSGNTNVAANSNVQLAAAPDVVAVDAAQVIAAASTPVLVFNGTGTSASDVTAVENVVKAAGFAYKTANSSQLDGMTQAQLAAYKLFIVPGGDSIKIGNGLTSKATTNVHNAVAQNGLNYLGMCAGAFFGGFSKYNGVNLTSGVWFNLYADYYKGIHKEAVMISFPAQKSLDIYWQNGPDLSGWGKVVGKYPNGKPAIVEGYWGKGFVLFSGVHPEAPAGWRTGLDFQTPLDVDLAYARTLVKAALNASMLPHY